MLERCGLSWISARSKHPKSDPSVQEDFKKIQEKLVEVIPEGVLAENIEIWFQDQGRVGQGGIVTRLWDKRGTGHRVIRQQQFEYAYMFRAVCPDKDLAVGLVVPSIGTDCMQKHLDEIAKEVSPCKHVVIFDQEAWHTTKKLRLRRNISLLPLPAVV